MLNKNLDAVKEQSPELVKRIKKAKCDWAQVVNAKNGKLNCLIQKSNRVNYMYPDKDPLFGAKIMTKQYKFNKDSATVLIGCGLGHTVDYILKKMDDGHKLVIVEPELYFVKKMLEIYDFSNALKNSKLFISTTKEDTAFIVNYLDHIYVIQSFMCIAEKYVMWCPEYEEIAGNAMEVVNQYRCNTGTVMGAGHIIAENDIKNLPYIIKHRGVSQIKDLFKGKPAISVNTGPSLKKNIHLLKEIQDNVIIIAVAQSLRILMAYGITPDFICTVDYGEVNYEHFKGIMHSQVPLVALNRVYADIIKEYSGPKFICSTPTPGFDDITSILQEKGNIEQGGSVSHMNLGLAIHLGCNPIGVIGQDFAYNDGIEDDETLNSHINQVDAGGHVVVENGLLRWKIDDPRSLLKKQDHVMGYPVNVDGYYGKPVITNIGLQSFITSFERIIENKENEFYQWTEGGADLKGTKKETLQRAIDRGVFKDKIDKSVLLPLLTTEEDSKIDEAIDKLKEDIDNYESLIENCKEGLRTNKEASEATDKKKLQSILNDNEKYSNDAYNTARKLALMGVSIFHASRKIWSKELKVSGKNLHYKRNEDNLKIRLERNELILSEALKSAKKLLKLYKVSYKLLLDYRETGDESLLRTEVNEPFDFSDADDYFNVGNWAHVLVDTDRYLKCIDYHDKDVMAIRQKALEMKIADISKAKESYKTDRRQDLLDYNEYINKAHKSGKEDQDFETALDFLLQAHKLYPDEQTARRGMGTTYYKLGNLDKSIETYQQLHTDYPENHTYQFELGMVMLEKDQQEGFKILHDVMSKTEQFDNYFAHLGMLYETINKEQSIIFYESYLNKFPGDINIMSRLKDCLTAIGQDKKAGKIERKINELKLKKRGK